MKLMSIYLSRILGNKIYSRDNYPIGVLKDLVVSMEPKNPMVRGAFVKTKTGNKYYDFDNISIKEVKGQYILSSSKLVEIKPADFLHLKKYILDKQIIDVNGRKVVRVNDVRLVSIESGYFVAAVDIGAEGLLRRLNLAKPIKKIGLKVPSKLMLWSDVATVHGNDNIMLSKSYNKLSTLHPSDLADIIEDFDSKTGMIIFSTLDNAKAADVLEELDEEAQISILEGLSTDKAADILEEMPADEVADILDGLKEEKAEELLNEMEKEASDEVRELMDYDEKHVGSLMNAEFIAYSKTTLIEEVISDLRKLKPEYEEVHNIYVVGKNEKLLGTISLRDLIVSSPELKLGSIMNKEFLFMYDTDKISEIIKVITKYNLLALPIVDVNKSIVGTILINDVLDEIIKNKKMIG